MPATKPAAMFALGDAVSIDSEDGATVQRYRVTGVEQVAGRYMATLTVIPIAGVHPPPIVISGEGPTVARATGAAEAKAWKALRVADKCVEGLPRERRRKRQVELFDGGKAAEEE
jgi:hypothetical protein